MAEETTRTQPERLLAIVTAALECAPGTRDTYLDEACGGDAALRAEAESLLGLEERARDFIARPAIEVHAEAFLADGAGAKPATTLQPGQTIDGFRIESLLGEGGMGEVYLAKDEALGRRVAIKLVKTGLTSRTILHRFEQEKRILAALSDPHIARLYGGGVTVAGLPYLVMEYVEGERLDEYCDRRGLSIEERLRLFRKVCAGVAYAHQHLVIHRDLKPANIRVTSDGEPKLLDFGIAKLLDPQAELDGAQTVTQLGAMTPGYASPEQWLGETVTTATDVYSLGVVLYELLSGRLPFERKRRAPGETALTAREEIAPRPSSLTPTPAVAAARGSTPAKMVRRLAGDLDNIVLMAIRREPARRYSSAGQFSEDIRRHLEARPVIARKETLRYVAAKFVSRNKAFTATAALVLLTLVGGIVATAWQAHRADEQRRRADRRFDDVRRLADSLIGEIHTSVEGLAGSTPTRKLIVARALEYLNSLSQEADSPALRRDLALAYEKIGNVQGNPYEANLGDTEGAMISYRKAESLLASLTGAGGVDPVEIRVALGRIYRALGDLFELQGNYPEMIREYRRSLDVFVQLDRENPTNPTVIDELARAYETLGDGVERMDNFQAEQLRCFKQALDYKQSLVKQDPANVKYRRGVAVMLAKVGGASMPDKASAVDYVTRAVAAFKALADENPENVQVRRGYAWSLYTLAWTLAETGDHAAAVSPHRQALAIREQIAAADPKDVQAQFDLAVAHANLADALTNSGQPEEAIAHSTQAVAIVEPMIAGDPGNSSYIRNCALFYVWAGNAHAALASRESADASVQLVHWTEAQAAYQRAKTLLAEQSAKGALRPDDASTLAGLTASLAKCEEQITRLKK